MRSPAGCLIKGSPCLVAQSDHVQWLSQDHQRAWTFVGEASRRHCASQIRGHHDAAQGRLRNPGLTETLIGMESARKPVVIATIVAALSIAILLVVNHTNLIIDKRPPKTPPGTTFNAVKDAGAEMTPSQPESPIKLPSLVPKPVEPAAPARPN
jgi:hypothetical protein